MFEELHEGEPVPAVCIDSFTEKGRLDYQPLFGKGSQERIFGEDHRPDAGDGGNRA